MKFSFSVKYLQDKKLNKLHGYDIKHILSALSFLSKHSWNEITMSCVKKYHEVPLKCIKVDKIKRHHEVSEEEELGTSSRSLISFSYKSEGRILGFRKGDEFFITYIDAKHEYT